MHKISIIKMQLLVAFLMLLYGFFTPVYSAEELNKIAYIEPSINVSEASISKYEADISNNNIQELKKSVVDLRKWVHSNSIVRSNTELVMNNEDYYNQLSYTNNSNRKHADTISPNNKKIKRFKVFNNSQNFIISSSFGYRNNPVTGLRDYHQGIDIPMRKGTPVYAYKKGVIEKVNNNTGLNAGKYVLIQHPDGSESYYMHLSKTLVKTDQQISEGELIGYSGSTGRTTGPHLHFEIRKNNVAVNPLLIGDVKWYIKSY